MFVNEFNTQPRSLRTLGKRKIASRAQWSRRGRSRRARISRRIGAREMNWLCRHVGNICVDLTPRRRCVHGAYEWSCDKRARARVSMEQNSNCARFIAVVPRFWDMNKNRCALKNQSSRLTLIFGNDTIIGKTQLHVRFFFTLQYLYTKIH